MDRIDFRNRAIIETHAQLIRFVVRGQFSSEHAAQMAILHGDALLNAMTTETARSMREPGHAPPDEL
jgi:hypothetical protein